MKNLVAYSLWGDSPMYWEGAKRNIELVNYYFPDWTIRFYVDSLCSTDLISTLHGDNVEVVFVDSKDSFHGMFWRFWASEDPDVDVFLSRDCDSRFTDREVSAIKEWLSSEKDFHIMRDHPFHTTAILGGMWGCRNGLMRNIGLNNLITKWSQYGRKGIDQEFLGQVVYPIIKSFAFEHSDFPNLNYGNVLNPFPVGRNNYEFVGEIFDENDLRNPDHWLYIKEFMNNEN